MNDLTYIGSFSRLLLTTLVISSKKDSLTKTYHSSYTIMMK